MSQFFSRKMFLYQSHAMVINKISQLSAIGEYQRRGRKQSWKSALKVYMYCPGPSRASLTALPVKYNVIWKK